MSRSPTSQVRIGWLLAVIGLAAVVGLFVARQQGWPWLRVLCKPLPVLAMAIWVAQKRDAHPAARRYGGWLGAGLLFGMLGDILLETPPNQFLGGLVAFLIGHVCYVVGMWRDDARLQASRLAPVLLFGGVMLMVLWPHLGALRLPVISYTVVIVAMGWRAWARVSAGPNLRPDLWTGALGATLFLFSDGMLAYNRFVAPLPAAGYMIILTYWAGQLGLARSILLPDPTPPPKVIDLSVN